MADQRDPPTARPARRRPEPTPDAAYWRGRDLIARQDWRGAAAAFTEAARLAPGQADYHRAFGLAIIRLDKFERALAAFQKAVALNPMLARGYADAGVTLVKMGRPRDAIPLLRHALLIAPELAQARATLGMALAAEGLAEEALAVLDKVAAEVRDPDIHVARAWAMLRQGRIAESDAILRAALALNPAHPAANHNLLFGLHYLPDVTAESLVEPHRVWGRMFAAAVTPSPRRLTRADAQRRPALGLVSGDLLIHAVGCLTLPAFEALHARGFEIVCYANHEDDDAFSRRFAALSRKFHRVQQTTDDELADLVRRERIDILFDLSGHTSKHRLGVFARRAAPVQVTWAGYVGAVGLDAIDALIADAREVPEGEEACYRERIIRLPDCYACYEPPPGAPEVAPPPAEAAGFVTFGCFNRPAKINVGLARLWARILEATPGARLLLRYGGFDDAPTQATMRAIFAEAGLPAERVAFAAGRGNFEMMNAYREIDIALDTTPYAGGVTTLEALWMGVPVVTLYGRSFAGRHGAAHLHAIGLTELIAADADGYVDIAAALARDPAQRAAYRAELRGRVQASPLCDAPRFAGHLDAALMALWRERAAGDAN